MQYTLPPLAYPYDALEPYIDRQTMELHHTKHHQTYINELNQAMAKEPSLQDVSLEKLLQSIDRLTPPLAKVVRNHGGGHYNHSLFWKFMTPHAKGLTDSPMHDIIGKNFASFENFKTQFEAAAKSVFGSGWAWLCIDTDGKCIITTTPNQENPIMHQQKPILGLDVWEHAYYLKYQNKRVDYIAAWWHVINWDAVHNFYLTATSPTQATYFVVQ